jgi:hypothetical protein
MIHAPLPTVCARVQLLLARVCAVSWCWTRPSCGPQHLLASAQVTATPAAAMLAC